MYKNLSPIFFLTIFMFSFSAFGKGCGHLSIIIDNQSGYECELLAMDILAGNYVAGSPPEVIEDGETSRPLQIQQGYFSGPSIQMDFRCGEKIMQLYSQQNFCLLSAGNISGQVKSLSNVHAKYIPELGAYRTSKPGRITWTIF